MSYRALQGKHEYRIMSGANLPMILEALSGRMQDLGLMQSVVWHRMPERKEFRSFSKNSPRFLLYDSVKGEAL